MKASFSLETRTIDVLVTSGASSISNSMSPDEAILFANVILSMAKTLQTAMEPFPVGPITRGSLEKELSR